MVHLCQVAMYVYIGIYRKINLNLDHSGSVIISGGYNGWVLVCSEISLCLDQITGKELWEMESSHASMGRSFGGKENFTVHFCQLRRLIFAPRLQFIFFVSLFLYFLDDKHKKTGVSSDSLAKNIHQFRDEVLGVCACTNLLSIKQN